MMGGRTAAPSGDGERVLDVLVAMAPAAAAIIAMMTLTLNLWLAARVTVLSGRLRRPWPDLRTTTLPRMTLVALVIAVALCFVDGLLAILGQIAGAALLMAYALTGFAVLHTLTQSISGRGFVLGAAYAATLFIGWPVLAVIGLGLADAIFGIRQGYRARRGPPTPVT
jgi:hypothetical protein